MVIQLLCDRSSCLPPPWHVASDPSKPGRDDQESIRSYGRRSVFILCKGLFQVTNRLVLIPPYPSHTEIHRAALILHKMASSSRGAEGVRGKDGKEEMIDKPMVLQASLYCEQCSFDG